MFAFIRGFIFWVLVIVMIISGYIANEFKEYRDYARVNYLQNHQENVLKAFPDIKRNYIYRFLGK